MPVHVADIIGVLFFGPLAILIVSQALEQLSQSRPAGALKAGWTNTDYLTNARTAKINQGRINVGLETWADRRAA
jgi:hypothetical protein